MSDGNSVAVKIGYNGELHRLRVDLNTFTLEALTRLFVGTFGLVSGAFIIKYTDADGDTLNVCSDAEFVEACRVFLSGNRDELKAVKFTAVARPGAATPTTAAPSTSAAAAAEPLIAAVERLVVTLHATAEEVQRDERQGMEAATAALHQAAVDARETLEAARIAVQEKPFEQVLEETSDGLKSAAVGISSFAQRLMKTFIPEKKTVATADEQQQHQQQPEEKVELAPAQEEDVHEETVDSAAAPEAIASPPEVEVAAAVPPPPAPVAFSDDEIKWAEQLSVVRGIFPDVETARVVEMLERSQGDVNIVINVLMEQMM